MGYTFIGNWGNGRLGYAVSSAGDVDGDGETDLLISAPFAGFFRRGHVYLIDSDDLAAADAADGAEDGVINVSFISAQANSYQFIAFNTSNAGLKLASAGDTDNDGQDDILISTQNGFTGGPVSGDTFLINADALAAADAADGTEDGVIRLDNIAGLPGSYQIVGATDFSESGSGVGPAGDIDGDMRDDILIGAQEASDIAPDQGEAFLISSAELAALDLADGTTDGLIDLAFATSENASYRFIAEEEFDYVGGDVSSADVDGDGTNDLVIAAPQSDSVNDPGIIYVIDSDDLAAADAADGTTDQVVHLENVAMQPNSYEIGGGDDIDKFGFSVASAGDVDNDGKDDLLVGAFGGFDGGKAYLLNAKDLALADLADGTADGQIDVAHIAAQPNSFELFSSSSTDVSSVGQAVDFAGDIDGDDKDDLLIGAPGSKGDEAFAGGAFLIDTDDLTALDAADGTVDGKIDLSDISAGANSYRLNGTSQGDRAGEAVSGAGDVTGDGLDDLLVGSKGVQQIGFGDIGEVYFLDASRLETYDAADGFDDNVISLSNVFCFAPGTWIATPAGEALVEQMRIGDLVRTVSGETVPVLWVGRHTVTRQGAGAHLQPVRIRAGALGDGLPHTDLSVTADHGMVIDGYVINASALVNGDAIDFVPMADLPEKITFYHIETENHDVILANGAPSETFIDAAGRKAFDNYQEYLDLYAADRIISALPLPRISAARLVPQAIKARLCASGDTVFARSA
ncbi:MAG: Hint domain-containing protein [Pseudomonadota bacterium]